MKNESPPQHPIEEMDLTASYRELVSRRLPLRGKEKKARESLVGCAIISAKTLPDVENLMTNLPALQERYGELVSICADSLELFIDKAERRNWLDPSEFVKSNVELLPNHVAVLLTLATLNPNGGYELSRFLKIINADNATQLKLRDLFRLPPRVRSALGLEPTNIPLLESAYGARYTVHSSRQELVDCMAVEGSVDETR